MELTQFTKRREFDIGKLNLHDDPDEKHDIIVGRDICRKIGLGMLNSTQQFHWHENLINTAPSGCQKDKKNLFKKREGNMNEAQIEEAEEKHGMTKIQENKHKKQISKKNEPNKVI